MIMKNGNYRIRRQRIKVYNLQLPFHQLDKRNENEHMWIKLNDGWFLNGFDCLVDNIKYDCMASNNNFIGCIKDVAVRLCLCWDDAVSVA